ncbi:permease [Desulfosporosinus sp. SB140]|uniref:permease n=1 Tax=Desulfosporosinus paludis TaxID=3115649 RepID=UPI003890038F
MWEAFVNYLVYNLMGLSPETKLGSAVNFFIYDTVKILVMLSLIIFLVTMIRSFFPPEKTKKILSHNKEFIGNIIAALMGIVTPFCSCSAVPVFIGFVEAGVPLGVTFSFLISSPMVNEVALGMLWVMFGWKIALIYIASGLVVAILGGIVIGRLKLEHLVEDYVYQIGTAAKCTNDETCCSDTVNFAEEQIEYVESELSWKDRLQYAKDYAVEILQKVWLYVIIGIAIGAVIHGYAPADFLVKYAGKGNPFAVPIAVAIGVPLYSNAAGTIPIVNALMEKGMPLGTVLAFMMSVTALSLPEMIILRQVLKPKLIAIFVTIIALAIMVTGYFFNLIM